MASPRLKSRLFQFFKSGNKSTDKNNKNKVESVTDSKVDLQGSKFSRTWRERWEENLVKSLSDLSMSSLDLQETIKLYTDCGIKFTALGYTEFALIYLNKALLAMQEGNINTMVDRNKLSPALQRSAITMFSGRKQLNMKELSQALAQYFCSEIKETDKEGARKRRASF